MIYFAHPHFGKAQTSSSELFSQLGFLFLKEALSPDLNVCDL